MDGRLQMRTHAARPVADSGTLALELTARFAGLDLFERLALQGNAVGPERRTTPLIGLHLRQRYLHDGCAATLRDAIQAHGGEAEIVRNRFFDLDEVDPRLSRQAARDRLACPDAQP
jgi:Di-haem oxidoreductase, putative peroxidase